MSTFHPSVRKLREAVSEISGKTGVNAATIATVTEKFVALLASRFEHICDVALADENEGKVAIGLTIRFDMTHKTPVGTVTLGFSQRTKDEASFQVEDPDQMNIPFAEAVAATRRGRTTANQSSVSTATPSAPSAESASIRPSDGQEPSSTPSRTRRRRRQTGPVTPATPVERAA